MSMARGIKVDNSLTACGKWYSGGGERRHYCCWNVDPYFKEIGDGPCSEGSKQGI